MDYIGKNAINHKLKEFKRHLENADRMILSAKFGDGKSFFLNEVRENKELFSEYEFITLYPVNYVVSKNEDIFEYIKRDILLQLAKLNLLNKIDLNKLISSVGSFENIKEVLFFVVSCIPQYGPFIKKMLEKGLDIAKKYNDEKETYEKYFSSFKIQRGGLYEDDGYTKIISEAVSLLNNGYLNKRGDLIQKKPVLIIEDLDRLDPAHLFRILNVISAHIDDATQPDNVRNKFGFSNIVLVMDYDTTKHIFEHFYGMNASYVGYMSKFISEEPFRYSITSLALPLLKNKLAREIGITKEYLDTFKTFNEKLQRLSIRDIIRLHDLEISSRLYWPAIKTRSEISFSTQLPIFKLFVYMTELGMDYADIEDELSFKTGRNELDYLKLIIPLCFMGRATTKTIYDYGSNRVEVQLIKENDIVVEIKLEDYYGEETNVPSISSLSRDFAAYCEILSNYIDVAGFNRRQDRFISKISWPH